MTTLQQINIGNASSIYASNELSSGIVHGGSVDKRLPYLIYAVRQGLEWLYELDPTHEDLVLIGNLLISICKHSAKSQANISGSGTSVSPTLPQFVKSPIRITGADFDSALSWTGTNADGITISAGYTLQVFWNDVNRFIDKDVSWERTATGFDIIIDGNVVTDFDATTTNNNSVFYIYISI